jgi:formylglycine-generating enzyme required for sulfatase activity
MKRVMIYRAGLSYIVIAIFAAAMTMLNIHQAQATGSNDSIGSAMVLLKGGTFLMGTPSRNKHRDQAHGTRKHSLKADVKDPAHEVGDDDERPAHRVTLSPFYIDPTEVTNREFADFVKATGYKTDAERRGSSWVFRQGMKDWADVEGADWRHPLGPESTITDKMDHPAVNISWNDAAAYADWAGKRLPTEAEWEYAARGGREGEVYPWGNELKPDNKVMANFWQGTWPDKNELEDGSYYTSPVALFSANGFGVYDLIGNVWEWTADWYAEDYYRRSPARDPKGPATGDMRVARGGSWFCSENYCGAYRVGFRGKSPQDASFNNVGFRCAKDAKK